MRVGLRCCRKARARSAELVLEKPWQRQEPLPPLVGSLNEALSDKDGTGDHAAGSDDAVPHGTAHGCCPRSGRHEAIFG